MVIDDVLPSLRIDFPRHGSRMWDVARIELRTSLDGNLDLLPSPASSICLELAREWEETKASRWNFHHKPCQNATSWRWGECNNTGIAANVVSSVCYGVADLRWRQVWWDNYEPLCVDASGVRWVNHSFGPLESRCSAAAMRLTVRALARDGRDVLPAARSRFFVASRQLLGQPFPGGAFDGLGNIFVSNACRVRWQGQLAQDALVLGMHLCRKEGFYIDIGAMDGEHLSNTAVLDRYGWSGLCVDPFPQNMQRRSCQVERVVLHSEKKNRIDFYVDGAFSRILTPAHQHVNRTGVDDIRIVGLATERLDALIFRLGLPQVIDYLSLDVEGMEMDVLEAFPFKTHVARVITVEHNQNEFRRASIRGMLQEHGYTFTGRLRWDDVYTFQLGS